MKQLAEISSKFDMEQFVDEIVGENKECEKNLLMAVALFLKSYCPENEQDYDHMIDLVLATSICKKMRNPASDFDKMMSQVETVDPTAPCLVYYNAYKMYPDGVANQAAGNLVYKLSKQDLRWPKRSLGGIIKEAIASLAPTND